MTTIVYASKSRFQCLSLLSPHCRTRRGQTLQRDSGVPGKRLHPCGPSLLLHRTTSTKSKEHALTPTDKSAWHSNTNNIHLLERRSCGLANASTRPVRVYLFHTTNIAQKHNTRCNRNHSCATATESPPCTRFPGSRPTAHDRLPHHPHPDHCRHQCHSLGHNSRPRRDYCRHSYRCRCRRPFVIL